MVEFVALLWPIFLQPVYKLFVVLTCWTVCWFMLICVCLDILTWMDVNYMWLI